MQECCIVRRTDKWSLTGQLSDVRGKLKRVNALAAGFKSLGRVGLGIELISRLFTGIPEFPIEATKGTDEFTNYNQSCHNSLLHERDIAVMLEDNKCLSLHCSILRLAKLSCTQSPCSTEPLFNRFTK